MSYIAHVLAKEKLKKGKTVIVNGMKIFEEAWIRRLSQFSTVIILKTCDIKRLEPFIKFLWERYSKVLDSLRERVGINTFKVYLYKIWSGLFQVTAIEPHVELEPVTLQQAGAGVILQALSPRIRDLSQALLFIDQEMERGGSAVVSIFFGLDSRNDDFVRFVRNAIFSDEYYSKMHTIVIFTEDPEKILDPDTIRESILVEIPPSTEEERSRLISEIANSLGLRLGEDKLRQLVELTRGLTLHELESVLLESYYRYRDFVPDAIQSYKYDIVRKSGIVDVEEPSHGFEAVGGYDVIKKFIMDNIVKVLRNPEKARKLGLRPPRGILLFGPGGTGKTWLARALAKELGIPFLRLRTEKIVSELYGRTERNLARAIEIAESVAPCVFFIDEVDRFGRRAGLMDADAGTTRRVFSMLLEWLGDAKRQSIVVATTNVPEQLDEAFIRVGRFDYIIPILYPDYKARLEILKVHTQVIRKVPLAEDVDLAKIASKTEYWTGAELEELVLRACRFALQEDADVVEMRHFEKALQTFRINEAQRRQQAEKYIKLAEEYCNDAQFLEELKKALRTGTRIDTVRTLLETESKCETETRRTVRKRKLEGVG